MAACASSCDAVPPSRLLRLLGVEHVITDKGFDVWWDGVYYDLELSTRLKPGEAVVVQEADRLEATGLGLWSHLDGGAALPDGAPVAEVLVEGDGGSETLLLRAGQQTAEGQWSAAAAPCPARCAPALAATSRPAGTIWPASTGLSRCYPSASPCVM